PRRQGAASREVCSPLSRVSRFGKEAEDEVTEDVVAGRGGRRPGAGQPGLGCPARDDHHHDPRPGVRRLRQEGDGPAHGGGRGGAGVPRRPAVVMPKPGQAVSPRALWEAVEKAGKTPTKLEGPSGTFTARPRS